MRFEAAVRLEDKVETALNNKDWEAGYTAYMDILVGEGMGGEVIYFVLINFFYILNIKL